MLINYRGIVNPNGTIWEGVYKNMGLKPPEKVCLCLTDFDAFLVSLVVKEFGGKNIFKKVQDHFSEAEDQIRDFLGFPIWNPNHSKMEVGIKAAQVPITYAIEKYIHHWWNFDENLISYAYHLTRPFFPGKDQEGILFSSARCIEHSIWNTRYDAEHGFLNPYRVSNRELLEWGRLCETPAVNSLMAFVESSNGKFWPFERFVIITPKMNF